MVVGNFLSRVVHFLRRFFGREACLPPRASHSICGLRGIAEGMAERSGGGEAAGILDGAAAGPPYARTAYGPPATGQAKFQRGGAFLLGRGRSSVGASRVEPARKCHSIHDLVVSISDTSAPLYGPN